MQGDRVYQTSAPLHVSLLILLSLHFNAQYTRTMRFAGETKGIRSALQGVAAMSRHLLQLARAVAQHPEEETERLWRVPQIRGLAVQQEVQRQLL